MKITSGSDAVEIGANLCCPSFHYCHSYFFILRGSASEIFSGTALTCVTVLLRKIGEFCAEFPHGDFIADLVECAGQLVLHHDIRLVAGITCSLERNDALAFGIIHLLPSLNSISFSTFSGRFSSSIGLRMNSFVLFLSWCRSIISCLPEDQP